MSSRGVILRLAHREYFPLAGWILGWVAIALFVGHADAVRLLAATMFVRAARVLTVLDSRPAIRRRRTASADVLRQSLSTATHLDTLSLLAGLVALGTLIGALEIVGQHTAAWMAALVGVGLPARAIATAGCSRIRHSMFRSLLSWCGLALVVAAHFSDLGLPGIALALGLREWLALGIVWRSRQQPNAVRNATTTPLQFAEVAGTTAMRGRYRLNYRIGKALLAVVLGPLGSVVARTGRGMGMHRRFERLTPRTPKTIAALAIVTAGAAVSLLLLSAEPVALVVSASLLRIAAAAGSVLAWWRFAAVADDGRGEEPEEV